MRELARQHTEEAIQALAAIMQDEKQPATARVRAAECLIDRAWGRLETTANVNLPPRDVREMSTAELYAIINAAKDAGTPRGSIEGR